ncbi:MAG TPA: septum site-determining protein MinC [Ramlibacter sp.]|uniref:septum site-determining protein MinC n=1 Tax=Ramlibacter sp. TaxID=1917967 RepID=UPI002BB99D34|nr:septum site-determining protein MinC [Ramlibacter sp.]HVZ46913.1 septum site-determining protein MinC [Ramlibacter sp.]
MPHAIAGRAPATFEIKSAHLPLVALLLKSPDLGALERELNERFAELPQFFEDDALLLDLSPVEGTELDFDKLIALLKRYRVLPVAARGGNEAQMRCALAAGLAPAADATLRGSDRVRQEPPHAPPPAPSSALVIDRPLRSGQQVYARGRDIVVLSMVNAGAEVIADGHVHVYAPLRGKAIAGARGNSEARIITLGLEPQFVSIAGTYRTSEVPFPHEVQGRAAQVRLVGDRLVASAL